MYAIRGRRLPALLGRHAPGPVRTSCVSRLLTSGQPSLAALGQLYSVITCSCEYSARNSLGDRSSYSRNLRRKSRGSLWPRRSYTPPGIDRDDAPLYLQQVEQFRYRGDSIGVLAGLLPTQQHAAKPQFANAAWQLTSPLPCPLGVHAHVRRSCWWSVGSWMRALHSPSRGRTA